MALCDVTPPIVSLCRRIEMMSCVLGSLRLPAVSPESFPTVAHAFIVCPPDLVDKIGNVIAFADAILHPNADASVSVADTLFFVQTCMPKYVSHLLKRDDIDEENALFVADLLKRGIDLTLHMGQFDFPDVFKEILARVFNDNYNFYATYGTVMDDMALYDSDEDEAAALAAVAAAQKADALAAAAANGDAPPGDDGAGETGGDDQPPTPPPRMSKADADRERRLAVGDIYAYVPNVAWDVSQVRVPAFFFFFFYALFCALCSATLYAVFELLTTSPPSLLFRRAIACGADLRGQPQPLWQEGWVRLDRGAPGASCRRRGQRQADGHGPAQALPQAAVAGEGVLGPRLCRRLGAAGLPAPLGPLHGPERRAAQGDRQGRRGRRLEAG